MIHLVCYLFNCFHILRDIALISQRSCTEIQEFFEFLKTKFFGGMVKLRLDIKKITLKKSGTIERVSEGT